MQSVILANAATPPKIRANETLKMDPGVRGDDGIAIDTVSAIAPKVA